MECLQIYVANSYEGTTPEAKAYACIADGFAEALRLGVNSDPDMDVQAYRALTSPAAVLGSFRVTGMRRVRGEVWSIDIEAEPEVMALYKKVQEVIG